MIDPPLGGEAVRSGSRPARSSFHGPAVQTPPFGHLARGKLGRVAEKLREYNRKRDPKQTPEPFTSKRQARRRRRSSSSSATTRGGSTTTSGSSGTARSRRWAVPKGVPLEPGQRALAVHVEDHPLDYATFEGEIPKGNYGAGTVEIWDNGTYELVEEKQDGGLTVRLHGKRLEGTWTLVPAHLDGDPKNWLLIRKRDDDGAAQRRLPQRLQADARDARRRSSRRATTGSTRSSGTATARSATSAAARRASCRATTTT